jgi:hypothetical protein
VDRKRRQTPNPKREIRYFKIYYFTFQKDKKKKIEPYQYHRLLNPIKYDSSIFKSSIHTQSRNCNPNPNFIAYQFGDNKKPKNTYLLKKNLKNKKIICSLFCAIYFSNNFFSSPSPAFFFFFYSLINLLLWPDSVFTSASESRLHTLIVLSLLPENRYLPSSELHTENTPPS